MAIIELDVAFDGSFDSIEESLVNLAPDKIFYRITQLDGPAGGWPLVEFQIDTWDQASALVSWYLCRPVTLTGPDDELESVTYAAIEDGI